MTKQTVYLNNYARKSEFRLHFLRQSDFKTHHCWRGLMTSPISKYSIYSITCIQRPLKGSNESGLCIITVES